MLGLSLLTLRLEQLPVAEPPPPDAFTVQVALAPPASTLKFTVAVLKVAEDPVLIAIGQAHGKTPGQVTLRWQVQQGVVTIPRTRNPARLAENFDLFDFALSDAEMARIYGLARPDGRIGDWLDPAFEWDAD